MGIDRPTTEGVLQEQKIMRREIPMRVRDILEHMRPGVDKMGEEGKKWAEKLRRGEEAQRTFEATGDSGPLTLFLADEVKEFLLQERGKRMMKGEYSLSPTDPIIDAVYAINAIGELAKPK